MKRKPGFNYRLCRVCGLDWNVPKNQTEQHYICPYCAGKNRKKEKTHDTR